MFLKNSFAAYCRHVCACNPETSHIAMLSSTHHWRGPVCLVKSANNVSDSSCFSKNKTHLNRTRISQIRICIHCCWKKKVFVKYLEIHMYPEWPHNSSNWQDTQSNVDLSLPPCRTLSLLLFCFLWVKYLSLSWGIRQREQKLWDFFGFKEEKLWEQNLSLSTRDMWGRRKQSAKEKPRIKVKIYPNSNANVKDRNW